MYKSIQVYCTSQFKYTVQVNSSILYKSIQVYCTSKYKFTVQVNSNILNTKDVNKLFCFLVYLKLFI